MEQQVLTNPQLPPTPALLQEVLGDNFVNFNAVMTMLGKYDIISEWNYYKDGKSWLCKALYKGNSPYKILIINY